MKTKLILTGLLVSVILTAQEFPFVVKTEWRTNVIPVAAHGIIAAHTITSIARLYWVADAESGRVTLVDQPAVRMVSVTTNLVAPLLSRQTTNRVNPHREVKTNAPSSVTTPISAK